MNETGWNNLEFSSKKWFMFQRKILKGDYMFIHNNNNNINKNMSQHSSFLYNVEQR